MPSYSLPIENPDLDPLLEPQNRQTAEEREQERKTMLQRQIEYFYGGLTLRHIIFTLFITIVDCGVMIAEIFVEGGVRACTFVFAWINYEMNALDVFKINICLFYIQVAGIRFSLFAQHDFAAGWMNIGTAALVTMGAKKTTLIAQGQVWRLFTAMFLHVGFLHLVLNLYSQLIVGIETERTLGPFRLAFVYFVSGIGGNALSAVFMPRITAVGASGPIFGLFAIYFVDLAINWRIHKFRYMKVLVSLSHLSPLALSDVVYFPSHFSSRCLSSRLF